MSAAGRIDEIWPGEVGMTFSERKRDHGCRVRGASGRQRGIYNDRAPRWLWCSLFRIKAQSTPLQYPD
jgi:hypothetical protein